MKIIDIGLILYPSTRSLAYLDVFNKLNILPSEIIIMKNNFKVTPKLLKEDKKYGYSKKFFNLEYNFEELELCDGVKKYTLNTKDINSQSMIETLRKCKNKKFIFSGGGVLKGEILSINKKFIHIHSGDVLKYKGSTCFYYSILNENQLSCSAFYINKKIDCGRLIDISNFNVNFKICDDQPLFMDQVLDPFIRSISLKKILTMKINGANLDSKSQNNKRYLYPYYVIHPLLRLFCIKKINKLYKNKKVCIDMVE